MNREPFDALIAKMRAQAEKCRSFVPSQHIGPLWGVGYIDACKSMAGWVDETADELAGILASQPRDEEHEDNSSRVDTPDAPIDSFTSSTHELIRRIVTGDNAQLENLDMTDDE